MNTFELYLMLLCLIHLIIWCFAMFGCIISKKIALFNIFILLPIMYVAQSMSFHCIMKSKIDFVSKYKDILMNKTMDIPDDERDELTIEAKKLNMTGQEFINILGYIENYSDKYIIPKLYETAKRKLYTSYRNPLSSQGTIILCYIINLYCLRYRYGVVF
uniref:Uncharacterized protein n=1 Tax=viral metagenome TaxID=1070528 RepID=A0A6C0LYI5_9ZZZZ